MPPPDLTFSPALLPGVMGLLLGLIALGSGMARLTSGVLPPDTPAPARRSLGIALALSLLLVAFRLAGTVDYRLGWVLAPLGCLAVLPRSRPSVPLGIARPLVSAILLLALTSRVALALSWPLPPGWDPGFHLMLARSVQAAKAAVSTWAPYADLPLTYPVGPHVLIAALADVLHLPLHTVFALLIATFSVVLGGLVYALTWLSSHSPDAPTRDVHATSAALLFLFAAWMGSTHYLGWGGLPNLLGLCCLLGALTLLTLPHSRARTRLLALAFAGAATAHHHVLLTAALLLPFLLPALPDRRKLMAPLALAGVLAVPTWLPLLLKLATVDRTASLSASEPWLTPEALLIAIGPGFCLLLVAFPLLAVRKLTPPLSPVVVAATLGLLALFLLGDTGCRLLAKLLGRFEFTLFTPSRFVTDAVPLLAIPAGAVLASIPLLRRRRALLLASVVLLSVPVLARYRELLEPIPPDALATCRAAVYLRDHTPATGTLVVVQPFQLPADHYIPYLSGRPTTYLPLPNSEPLADLPPDRVSVAEHLYAIKPASTLRPGQDSLVFPATRPAHPSDPVVVRLR